MAYNSKYGKSEPKGKTLGESISGNGILPCGTYTVKVLVVQDSTITVEEPARGTHVELLPEIPEWIEVGDSIELTIGLTSGVYAKIERGKIALFDAELNLRITDWLADLDQLKSSKKKYTPASPIITEIKKKQKGANLVWRRDSANR